MYEIPKRLDKVAFLAIQDAALETMSRIGRQCLGDEGPPHGTLEALPWACAKAAHLIPSKEGGLEGDPAAIREAARAAFFEAYECCSQKLTEDYDKVFRPTQIDDQGFIPDPDIKSLH